MSKMTKNARVEASHWLRGFDHHVEEVIAALSPATGMAEVTGEQWEAQMQDLEKILHRIWHQFAPGPAMRKIKVRFTGLGRPKTLTYQTAQDVTLGQEVEVPRWPGMKPGPYLRGKVVALESDREGPLTTIIGG